MTRVADQLSDVSPSDDHVPFQLDPAWFACWDAAYLKPGMRAHTIEGIALLDETRRQGPLRHRVRRARTNVHTPLFNTAQKHLPDDIAQRLLADGIDLVRLDYLPEESPLLTALGDLSPRRARIEPHALAPAVDCRRDYASWLARRGKRIRTRAPKMEAHARDKLGMHFERHERFDDLPGLLSQLFAVERSGWKGRAGSAIADDPADALFYTALATKAAAAGALRIALLKQDDRVVAFEYGILGGDRLFLLKVGYDEAFEAASIGHVLTAMHIRDCCEDPRIDWYDKLGNGMTPAPYKLRYADLSAPRYRITLYGDTLAGRALRLVDDAKDVARGLRKRWRAARA